MFVWINSGFRALLTERPGSALGGSFIMPVVAALVLLPVGTLLEGCGRFVDLIGLPQLAGAAIVGRMRELRTASMRESSTLRVHPGSYGFLT